MVLEMDQKIKKLAEQSGFFPVPDETEVYWEYRAENARYEKFAELIIEDIINLIYEDESLSVKQKVSFENKIWKHFDIEVLVLNDD